MHQQIAKDLAVMRQRLAFGADNFDVDAKHWAALFDLECQLLRFAPLGVPALEGTHGSNAVPVETPFALSYEALMAKASPEYVWPQFDERTASSLCYTSGTTGNPKGVLYTHRSTVLHGYGIALPDCAKLSATDVVLPVVPMFHANAWSLAYSVPMVGAKLVLPGARLDGASVAKLLAEEEVTFVGGVPTIWSMLLTHLQQHKPDLPHFKHTLIGGSAVPASMIAAFDAMGVEVVHGWGMTETSPIRFGQRDPVTDLGALRLELCHNRSKSAVEAHHRIFCVIDDENQLVLEQSRVYVHL